MHTEYRRLPNESDNISAQGVEFINLYEPQVPSSSKRSVRRERSTTPIQIITRSAKKFSDGSQSNHRTETSAAKPLATAGVIKIKTENDKRPPEDPSKG